ncbi:MAG: ribbon-helix-helix domain-containing protein [Planctomycetota bacterium]|nr:ribbon-helix-helix domain-containing protein [Planctomycetota bacterium]
MTKRKLKAEIITFKADESLLRAISGVPNRSKFIREAVLAALDNACPVCGGTGVLTPNQKRHWQEFAADHFLTECNRCHEFRLVCSRNK